jgi:hypothetical protein
VLLSYLHAVGPPKNHGPFTGESAFLEHEKLGTSGELRHRTRHDWEVIVESRQRSLNRVVKLVLEQP